MKMRPLVIDDDARAEIARVLSYAKDHHFRQGMPIPGHNPFHVATLSTYRVVFTFTEAGGRLFRHLTISVPGEQYPNPAAGYMLATEFGFTGWDQTNVDKPPDGWGIKVNEKEHCIVIAQEVPPE